MEGPGYIEPGAMVYFLYVCQTAPARASYFLSLRHVGEDTELSCQVFERIGIIEAFSSIVLSYWILRRQLLKLSSLTLFSDRCFVKEATYKAHGTYLQ
jgi:hypothetical protein